jgi:hypothetical protein
MPERNCLSLGLIGAGLLALSTGAALATSATVETNAKVRSGPGTHYRTLAVVRAGSAVDLIGQSGHWCAVDYGPRQGYIACSLLSDDEEIAVMAPAAPPALVYGGGYYARPAYVYYEPRVYAAWPAPTYPYYRDYYFRPGLAFGVGVGF